MSRGPRAQVMELLRSYANDGPITPDVIDQVIDFLMDEEAIATALVRQIVTSAARQLDVGTKTKSKDEPIVMADGKMLSVLPKFQPKATIEKIVVDLAGMNRKQVEKLADEVDQQVMKEVEVVAFLRFVAASLSGDQTVNQRFTQNDLWRIKDRIAVVQSRKIYFGEKFMPSLSERRAAD